ncbi:MarR family winged helix-turn-helix transcriptional regulator [Micromonospora auratinigra]|uniref:DNA-binding transcriptional regulator, MarR family n=1 Tax=Micromonospora auratinigra TaxID=261654 RepID=A0A1A9A6M7_9ACTN|nr:MarR family transcriptional regulator [Micromonospora auratinigra]SBT51827.1 DNA-binding transcriptional regulator, MarR family [Micromonospora auratinigra]
MEGVPSTGAPLEPSATPATSEAARALREVLRVAGDTRSALARRLGIGATDAAAIDHLVSSAEPLGPVELGNRLGIRSASATTLVDRLVQAGHVERTPHPHDRRRLSLQVTEHAVTEVLAALRPMLTGVERAVARLTPEQAEATTVFLREVAEVMRDYIATAPDDPTPPRRP